jgi:hypothetical protein
MLTKADIVQYVLQNIDSFIGKSPKVVIPTLFPSSKFTADVENTAHILWWNLPHIHYIGSTKFITTINIGVIKRELEALLGRW